VIVKTGRFGQLTIDEKEVIEFPNGILGFPECRRFCIIDPGDDTLILWLQSLDDLNLVFPVLEPRIFVPDYRVRLSAAELRELHLSNINQSAVYSILTIPSDLHEMTANLKAPIVINLDKSLGRQVVLQENEYSIKHKMFKELRTHLLTISSQSQKVDEAVPGTLAIQDLPRSTQVQTLRHD